jgi:hypothetical protein
MLVVVGVPRIPVVWGFVWELGDIVRGGVDDRQERLVDNPFPRWCELARLCPRISALD